MICSLNQIEQSARKAARGAGFAWGLADETGRAVRWLHANGFRGAAALADWLDGDIKSSGAPRSLSGVWRAPRGALDPLRTGAALGDCIESAGAVETGAIAHPLLAAGFLGDAAHIDELVIELQWPGARLQCMRGGARRRGTRPAFQAARPAHLKCSVARPPGTSAGLPRRAARFGEGRGPRGGGRPLERHPRCTYGGAGAAP
ncbi:MAG: DUF3726 domain-containing protein, partial [Gammaproteobacteria bacterium]|nr:DUF3726 domain-containing protein [Gammaproteobacteria bacterium]